MNNPNLLTRSSYTFFNSLLKISDIIKLSKDNGFSTAFLVDENIMYGAMEFYFLCKKNKIKPIIGLQVNYKGISKILIAKDIIGYYKLMEISSKIQLGEEIDFEHPSVIEFKQLISPVLYKKPNDIETLKDFHLIGKGEFKSSSTHFLDREEFKSIYNIDILNEIDNISDQVNLVIEEKKNIFPLFKVDGKAVDSDDYLEEKLKHNLQTLLNNNKNLNRKKYIERTSFELSVIKKMGFQSYFLIVSDIVSWAKSKNIFVGPGRGSAPGSMISYLLNITSIDPIANGLLFERFLNPDRVTMPDIDIDFEDTRREEVIHYITEKYGENNVAQIITFQTLRARMSFKDMARIKGLSASETNLITKLIPEDLTLEESYKKSKSFRLKIESSELLSTIYEYAKLVEGLPRQFSTHAAGVVISGNPIYMSVPIQRGYGESIQTQYSMDYMEFNGLLKIDILGLRNLSFIKETLEIIKKVKNKDIILEEIPFDDKKVYSLLASGKTSGVFQLESPGMKAALKEIGVTKFEEVVATTSLFRPGPMKSISIFANRKKGLEKIEYLNDDFKKILESTFGILVYQEQIMKVVQIFSNFTLSKADILRRAIGKKDIKLLESLKEEFFIGGKKNGFSDNVIQDTYDHIYEFSSYGFNRSHAFAYTIISYWLAWLKIHFPLEFMISLLNSVIGNANKTSLYISECEDLGINVEGPSIFNSSSEYVIFEESIYIGLKTIKRVGDSILRKINKLNINKDISLINLIIEFEKVGITQNNVEILVKSGALKEIGMNKSTILNNFPKIYEYINMIKIVKDDEISFDKEIITPPKIISFDEENEKEYFMEVMGFALNDKFKKNEMMELENMLNIEKINLTNLEQNQSLKILVEVISIREIMTKTGRKMAFGSVLNGQRKMNITLWPATFDLYSEIFKVGKKLIITGEVDLKRGETIIIKKAEEIE